MPDQRVFATLDNPKCKQCLRYTFRELANVLIYLKRRFGAEIACLVPIWNFGGSMNWLRQIRLVAGAVIITAGASTGARAGLIDDYEFSGATVTDSAGATNGSLFGDATVSGGFLNLGGAGYAELSGHVVPTTGDFTIDLRAAVSSFSGGGGELISQGISGGPGFYIGYYGSDIRLSDVFLSTGLAFPTDGLFHDYLLTSGTGGTNFYIDDTLMFSNPAAITAGAGGTDTRFGRQFDPYGEFITGQIDYVRIYDQIGVTNTNSVPEPLTFSLFGAGLAGAIAMRRRKKAA